MPDATMDLCGNVYASCVCIRTKGHEGPCACDCGGVIDDHNVYAFPVMQGLLNAQTIESHVARVTGDA